ncbi:MAG: hypothetical protein ACP5QI_06050, partial [Candidatus Bathyarchaeia archaeon]
VGFETIKENLEILKGVISGLALNKDRLEKIVNDSFMLAVDLAEVIAIDYGLPFRKAHILVGRIVNYLVEKGKKLRDLDPHILEKISKEVLGQPLIMEASKLRRVLDPIASLEARNSIGAPSPSEVRRMIESRTRLLEKLKAEVGKIAEKLEDDEYRLVEIVKSYIGD